MGFDDVVRICRRLSEDYANRPHVFLWYAPHGTVHFNNAARLAAELYPIFFKEYATLLEDAVVKCAAYLHDVGMHLLPDEINRLSIHASRLSIAGGRGEEIVKEYWEFFTGCTSRKTCTTSNAGVIRIDDKRGGECIDPARMGAWVNEECRSDMCQDVRGRVSSFIRDVHPWVSGAYVRSALPGQLVEAGAMYPQPARRFADVVGQIVELHAGGTTFTSKEESLLGFQIDVGRMGALIVLADAADVLRATLDVNMAHTVMCADYTSVAHHIYKRAFIDVRVEQSNLVFTLRDDAEPAHVLGAVLFEIGAQVAKDYIRTTPHHGGIPIAVRWRGRELKLGPGQAEELMKRAKELHNRKECTDATKDFYEEFTRIQGLQKLPCKVLHCVFERHCKDKPKLTPFDILAIAILLGLPTDGFQQLLERTAPPALRRLL